MHELAITERILEICLDHAARAGACQITDIDLVIGQLASMVDDSVQYYWHILSAGTLAAEATLHFRRIAAEMICQQCHTRYRLQPDQFICPACGSADVRISAGEEFYIESINVELAGEPHENPGR
jgi:hydrogenase nickel incorporation protein HypA/HybF